MENRQETPVEWTIPFHFRYQEPLDESVTLISDGFRRVVVDNPLEIVIECIDHNDSIIFQPIHDLSFSSPPPSFPMPSGLDVHKHLVTLITLSLTGLSSLVVIFFVFSSSFSS